MPPWFFSAYSTDQNEPLWRKKSAPLKKKKRPSEEKKAPPWKVSPLINLPLLLKNVTGTQCGREGEETPTEVIDFRIYHAERPTLFLVILKCLCDSTVKCERLEWHTSNLLESTWRRLTASAAQLQRRPPQGCCLTHWCTLHNYFDFSLEKWVTFKSFTRWKLTHSISSSTEW